MARPRSDKGSLRWKGKTLYWCGTVPFKDQATGDLYWRYVERSTHTSDESQAWQWGRAFQKECFEALGKPLEKKPTMSMALVEAIHLYLKDGGRNGEYLEKFVNTCPNVPIHEIDQAWMDAFAEQHFPGRTAATRNRAVFTPLCAVLNHVDLKVKEFTAPHIKRPRGWLPKSNFKRPPKDWWARVLPHCEPNLEAFLLFTRIHMRRTSEACAITPADVDVNTWRVQLWDSKEKQDISFELARPVIEALNKYEWQNKQYLFGFSSKSRVRKALVEACAKAGVPYHRPKDVGRHSGATFLLEQGKTSAEVKEAGRWASTRMVDLIYGHLERRAVDDQVRALNEEWAEKNLQSGEVIETGFPANVRQANGTKK